MPPLLFLFVIASFLFVIPEGNLLFSRHATELKVLSVTALLRWWRIVRQLLLLLSRPLDRNIPK